MFYISCSDFSFLWWNVLYFMLWLQFPVAKCFIFHDLTSVSCGEMFYISWSDFSFLWQNVLYFMLWLQFPVVKCFIFHDLTSVFCGKMFYISWSDFSFLWQNVLYFMIWLQFLVVKCFKFYKQCFGPQYTGSSLILVIMSFMVPKLFPCFLVIPFLPHFRVNVRYWWICSWPQYSSNIACWT
jgi:hypothetical protein